MTDIIIRSVTQPKVDQIHLADPIKVSGRYVAHASIEGKPIVYQLNHLTFGGATDSILTFNLGESGQLATHIVNIDARFVNILHSKSLAFFGRNISTEAIDAAYVSNAHDGVLAFTNTEDVSIKDQYGNTISLNDLEAGETVTAIAELVGVSIGKVTIKPAWKLHKILAYKKTRITDAPLAPDAADPTESQNVSDEAPSFYADAHEP